MDKGTIPRKANSLGSSTTDSLLSRGAKVVSTLEEVLGNYQREVEREEAIQQLDEVLRKLVELGWVDEEPAIEFSGEAPVSYPKVASKYALKQISEWVGAEVRLVAGILPSNEGLHPADGPVAEKLRKLGFVVGKEEDGTLVGRRGLVVNGKVGAWLEARST
jgi:hypothetical protein